MRITLSFDQDASSLPAAFVSAVQQAVDYVDNLFTNSMTFSLRVGFGEVNGQTLATGSLGASYYFFNPVTYSQLRGALSGHATSADDSAAVYSLPANDPTNGGHFWVSQVEDLALGLNSLNTAVTYVGFSNTASFDYDRTDGISAGHYDFFGTALHEITEVMGRGLEVGGSIGGTPSSYEPLDLFHYSAPGARTFLGTNPGYFSIDGGATNLDNFNTDPNGDYGDWAASAGHDAFLAFSSPGILNNLSETDLREMDILGYNRAWANTDDSFFWHNDSGQTAITTMNGLTATGTAYGPNSTWSLVGSGDFNGDGSHDMLWRNQSTGQDAIWHTVGTKVVSQTSIDPAGTNWKVVGVGDFDHDGHSDILWHDEATGDNAIWFMNGTTTLVATLIDPVSTNWSVAGTGDFNGDGFADILWRDKMTGDNALWEMNGPQDMHGVLLASAGTNWTVAGVGDLGGDGKADIFWRDNSTGQDAVWDMNGETLSKASYAASSSVDWHVAGLSDFNHDGHMDILWQNTANQVAIWEMNDATAIASQAIFNAGGGWHLTV